MRCAILLLLSLAACNVDSWDPPSNRPTPGYPCGPLGVICSTQSTCCTRGQTCGGEPESVGCPAGYCCFIGDYSASHSDDAGIRAVPQRPMR